VVRVGTNNRSEVSMIKYGEFCIGIYNLITGQLEVRHERLFEGKITCINEECGVDLYE
jgi:hypothetical protein